MMDAVCKRALATTTVVALAILHGRDANAATITASSALATLPAPVDLPSSPDDKIPGLTKEPTRGGPRPWSSYVASAWRGYCVATQGFESSLSDHVGHSVNGGPENFDLVRFVEKDGVASLERTRVRLEGDSAKAVGRSSVVLREVGRAPDAATVYAYRDGQEVVVLVRGLDGGVESPRAMEEGASKTTSFVSSSDCPFGIARLDTRVAAAGTVAQLRGTLPSEGTGKAKVTPRFTADVSLSRLARDREPLLAVRVRRVE